jgi:hypothetical protein
MSRWADQFEKNQIHQTVNQVREWIATEVEDIDKSHAAERLRLIKIIDTIKSIVEGLDPDIFPDTEMTQLSQHMRHQSFWNQLKSYSSNGNVAHLQTANDHITGQIPNILKMATLAKPPDVQQALRAIEEANDSFRKSIEKTKANFEKVINGYNSKISEFETQITNLQQEYDALKQSTEDSLADWQNTFTSAETTRAKEHSDAQIEKGEKFNEILLEFKDQAGSEREEISKRHDETLRKFVGDFEASVTDTLQDINQKHQSVLDIHELVANDGVAGGYKKNADEERSAANTWRIISMLCYGLILVWVVFKGWLGFGVAATGTLDWPVIVTTVSVTAVAFVAAQFASRQSRLHRINEQRMRWFALEVKAIDPFISSLPIEMQQELKRQLSERLFGQDRVADDSLGRGLASSSGQKILEKAVSAIQNR